MGESRSTRRGPGVGSPRIDMLNPTQLVVSDPYLACDSGIQVPFSHYVPKTFFELMPSGQLRINPKESLQLQLFFVTQPVLRF